MPGTLTELAWHFGPLRRTHHGSLFDIRSRPEDRQGVRANIGATAANTVVAYEPGWAIGTGKVPTLEEIGEVHDDMRARLVARFGAEAEGMRSPRSSMAWSWLGVSVRRRPVEPKLADSIALVSSRSRD